VFLTRIVYLPKIAFLQEKKKTAEAFCPYFSFAAFRDVLPETILRKLQCSVFSR